MDSDRPSRNSSGYLSDKENEQNESRESLSQRLQLAIEDVNIKRQQDTQVIADFKNFLDLQVVRTCTDLECKLFQIYENQGKQIEAKVQDIYAVLQRIDSLEKELHNFRTTVASFGQH